MVNVYTTASDPVVYYINPLETSTCTDDSFCLTLEQFAANISQHLKNQTRLSLQAGIHHISTQQINVINTEIFSITSETEGIINCNGFTGFTFKYVKKVSLTNIKLIGCGGSTGVINLFKSSASVNSCSFINSTGRVTVASKSTLKMSQSLFKSSYAGAITAQRRSSILIRNTIFESNTNKGVLYSSSSDIKFQKCTFHNNTVYSDIDLIRVYKSFVIITKCDLINNDAIRGSIIKSQSHTKLRITDTHFKLNYLQRARLIFALIIDNCTFTNNTITNIGLLHILYSEVAVKTNLDIRENSVEWGVLYTHQSQVTVDKNIKITRNYANQSIISIYRSIIQFNGSVEFSYNIGAFFIKESMVTFNNTCTFLKNEQTQDWLGGAITSTWSTVHFYGAVNFYKNKGRKIGGAITANESTLYIHSNATYSQNRAEKGGAMYLDHSYFTCQLNCTFIGNSASTKGGAIHATDSIIFIGNEWFTSKYASTSPRSLSFEGNHAKEGGAISLEVNAKIHGPVRSRSTYFIQFINNTAHKGAAIYVNDYGTCSNAKGSYCFLQTPHKVSSTSSNLWIILNIIASGNAIYGGLLDRCIIESGLNTNPFSTAKAIEGIKYITNISSNGTVDRITSDPVKLCYCPHGEMNCTYRFPPIKTEKGKAFQIPIAALDQAGNHINATVRIDHHYSTGIRLRDQQHAQNIPNECSNITLNVYSSHKGSVKLDLTADGPCNGTDALQIKVAFLNCTCPIGFQEIVGQSDNCVCDCDTRIQHYITECNESTKSVIREGNFWINYDNSTSDNHNGYIIYHNCPYDYCVLSTEKVSINLNNIHGADAQCAFNRTGLLCSTCKPPFNTLSLASSHCLTCTNNWPSVFIVTILAGGLCGIALVVIILILNLTVAVGTLNGLVFYANIVASNNIIYYRTGSQLNTVLSVFIAWLNLETGLQFDMCAIKGLDAYSKIWLQFSFPTYLIFVLFVIIAISRYSFRFARLIGKRNPIATLATLIFLSYMKFLRNIIDIFSLAVIHYPNGSHKVHWLPDANILYLNHKHIPLFLIATAIVVAGLSYIILLFSWQWLLQVSNYRLLRWIRNTRFNSFMEANVAAYTPKHRYWTGLLLFIRVILYLVIAYNTKEPRASFLATALIVASLLLVMVTLKGNIYRNKLIGCLNSSCYLNLLMLSIAHLYWQNNTRGQNISIEISIDVAFTLPLGVLIYHTIKTLLEISCLNQFKTHMLQRIQNLGKN